MKTVYTLVAFVAVSFLFASCGKKSWSEYNLTEYMGVEKEQIRELISKEHSFSLLDTLDLAIESIEYKKELDKYRNTTLDSIISDYKLYQEKLKPRKVIYDFVLQNLLEKLKYPETTVCSPLELENNLYVEIDKDEELTNDSLTFYVVSIDYKSQNSYGEFIEGVYQSFIQVDTTGHMKEVYSHTLR